MRRNRLDPGSALKYLLSIQSLVVFISLYGCTATLSGRIIDSESQYNLTGRTIILESDKLTRETTSDDSGFFYFANLKKNKD